MCCFGMASDAHLCLMFVFCAACVSATTHTDFLDWHCGGYIQLSQISTGHLKLLLTNEDTYSPNMDCQVTVRVQDDMRILVTFRYLDVQSVDQCLDDYLKIFDSFGQDNITEDELGSRTFCGADTPDEIASTHSTLTLRFVSDSVRNGGGFIAFLTAFHEGDCRDLEFRCDNRRCVDDDLHCDDVDNCGDGSDLCPFPVYVTVCVVLLSVLLVAAILILTVILWYRWKRRTQCDNQEHIRSANRIDYYSTYKQRLQTVQCTLN